MLLGSSQQNNKAARENLKPSWIPVLWTSVFVVLGILHIINFVAYLNDLQTPRSGGEAFPSNSLVNLIFCFFIDFPALLIYLITQKPKGTGKIITYVLLLPVFWVLLYVFLELFFINNPFYYFIQSLCYYHNPHDNNCTAEAYMTIAAILAILVVGSLYTVLNFRKKSQ